MTLCQQLKARNRPATKNSVMDQATGMLPELVTKVTAVSRLELGIKLDDRHGGLVPVGGVEDETLAFLEAEAFVALAEADVFDAAGLPAEVDGDLLAGGRGLGEGEVDHADVAGSGRGGSLALQRLGEVLGQEAGRRGRRRSRSTRRLS